MFRKLIVTGIITTVVAVLATPASAAGHVRHYTPSRTATVHMSHSNGVAKHHVAKLTKSKKSKGKSHKGGGHKHK
ncbi:MAG TPA: hypothetical protein VLI90_03015 [Tepidisphaeraceae bacterium]|nr:hypothetical protein [Tepidisphaeraceae bacterium]